MIESTAAQTTNNQDYTHSPVPLTERRGPMTMGLLWVTMVTCFPNVLIGFQWFKAGMGFSQVLWGLVISSAIILAYSIPSCYLGAKTGLTYALLSRSIFGSWGSRIVSLNSIWVATGWYALNAIFLADGLRGLFNFDVPQLWFAVGMAVLMAFNNFFGFSGVANFARFLAAPILICWVGYSFVKASCAFPPHILSQPGTMESHHALTLISSFVIGIACWGNEADYWRFGKPKWTASVTPLTISLLIGQIVFPLTGWMLARLFGITDVAGATRLMNSYTFGGISIISALVLAVSYVAVNDSGLYGAINAAENLHEIPRKWCVAGLAAAGALTTILLFGYKQNFEAVAALSCIFLPCSTVIMMAEVFIVSNWLKIKTDFSHVPDFAELPSWRTPAIVSLTLGCILGTVTSGFIPGTEKLQIGIPSLQGWLLSFFSYLGLRYLEIRQVKDAELPMAAIPSKEKELLETR
ncbi:MAG: cytosine permease [Candidatus Obscuribacterales bacterium]|nr:cytosine permease [Candidatus Obscuribacterales bacterium]